MKWSLFLVILVVFGAFVEALPRKASLFQEPVCDTPETCEAEAKSYVEGIYEQQASMKCQEQVVADFEYNIDLNDPAKEQASTEANIAYSKFIFEAWNNTLRHFNYTQFQDEALKRQLKFLNVVGTAALDDTDLAQYNVILANMSRIYGTAKICPFNNQNCNLEAEGLNLEPEIEGILQTSRNAEELAYVWKAWRDASGKQIREMYKEYIALSNKAAVENGLNNNGDLWLSRYEDEQFREQVAAVWDTVKELYQELYGYARFKLSQVYPDEFPEPTDPIPAHILGNMWAQSWEAIYPIVKPHPDEPGFDVTEKLQAAFPDTLEGVRDLFAEANEFFTGLGLADMSMSYGDKAMIIRPDDGRAVTCHASAWDFCDGQDFRIKMCTSVNQEDYITVHHELGHIQYFIQYKDQPYTFRDGANPGFHEAIGDVLALSVATPKHMAKLGYLNGTGELNKTVTENFLMSKALEKIAFLPFGYLIDSYRWKLFDGTASLDKMEHEWLKIRNEIQGIRPPVMRSEADFDPGAKYHVPGNTPYIRYFVSFILQFQIHKALCIEAGEYDPVDPNKPLYNCDIAGNVAAGAKMKTLLEKGFADNWQDVLQSAIGEREMDGSAIKEYFAPLSAYFKEQQGQHSYPLEWKMDAFNEYYDSSEQTTSDSTTSSDFPTTSDSPTSAASSTEEGNRSDKLGTGLIIVGIVQGVAIVVAMGAYVVKTFIMKS